MRYFRSMNRYFTKKFLQYLDSSFGPLTTFLLMDAFITIAGGPSVSYCLRLKLKEHYSSDGKTSQERWDSCD